MQREKKGSPVEEQCMYTPNTYIKRDQYTPSSQYETDVDNVVGM